MTGVPQDAPRHGFGWKDDELVQIASCNGVALTEHFVIDIYDWALCPGCGKELKLVQRNDVLMREAAPRTSGNVVVPDGPAGAAS